MNFNINTFNKHIDQLVKEGFDKNKLEILKNNVEGRKINKRKIDEQVFEEELKRLNFDVNEIERIKVTIQV